MTIRTPILHYDFIMGGSGAQEFYKIIDKQFAALSDKELLGGKIPHFISTLDATTQASVYFLQLYKRWGQHTYVIGPRVQDLFRRTNLARVLPEMIQAPVPAFYIALTDCPWKIWGGERTRHHTLTGIYVSFSKLYQGHNPTPGYVPASDLHDCINIALWGKPNERSVDKFDDALLWFSISLDQWMSAGQDLETFFSNHNVMTAKSMELKDWVSSTLDPFAQQYPPADKEAVATQRETLVNTLRLILNLCLYMSTEDPDLDVQDWKDKEEELRKKAASKKSPGKRKKMERQLSNLPRTRVVYVGPMFEELPGPDSSPAAPREHQGGTHASPLEHGVAPHWQRYWVGSGDDRKAKWTLKGMYVRGTGKADRTITKFREGAPVSLER